MSGAYGTADERQSFATMGAAIEQGIDFFDTADMYGRGHNEELIGRFIHEAGREKVIIGTKFGSIPAEDGGAPSVDNSPKHIAAACDASLKRLGVDTIDLYYMHRRDPEVPIEESVGAMAKLVEAGKVRALGLSEVSAQTLRKGHAVHPIAALQSEYSLWFRKPEKDVLPTCRELGITFVPFSPLGRAFLTGTLPDTSFDGRDIRSTLPRFQGEAAARNRKLVAKMADLAKRCNVTMAQLALAWLLAKNTDQQWIVPIPGTKRPQYVIENAKAARATLSPHDIAELEEIFSPDA
ncbi:MAG TPA: aldo/keto reductase, partial [Lacipirellulaceae bacterium]|nr:aldo/keto reductase [Lacipirellulaceae bacterium]